MKFAKAILGLVLTSSLAALCSAEELQAGPGPEPTKVLDGSKGDSAGEALDEPFIPVDLHGDETYHVVDKTYGIDDEKEVEEEHMEPRLLRRRAQGSMKGTLRIHGIHGDAISLGTTELSDDLGTKVASGVSTFTGVPAGKMIFLTTTDFLIISKIDYTLDDGSATQSFHEHSLGESYDFNCGEGCTIAMLFNPMSVDPDKVMIGDGPRDHADHQIWTGLANGQTVQDIGCYTRAGWREPVEKTSPDPYDNSDVKSANFFSECHHFDLKGLTTYFSFNAPRTRQNFRIISVRAGDDTLVKENTRFFFRYYFLPTSSVHEFPTVGPGKEWVYQEGAFRAMKQEGKIGYCLPAGNGEEDLCHVAFRASALPLTCLGSDDSGRLPKYCNQVCVQQRCAADPACVGYTWRKDTRQGTVKAKIIPVKAHGNYECHQKQSNKQSNALNQLKSDGLDGYCLPWQDNADLCSPINKAKALPATCQSSDDSGYLPSSCNKNCVEQRCAADPACAGYTWRKDTGKGKPKYIVFPVYAHEDYECHQKITNLPLLHK